MKKKLLSMMLALCLAAGTATCPYISTKVHAQEQEQTEDSYQYKILNDGTAVITKYVGKDTIISIPSEIGGKKVTIIGKGAFINRENLEEVAILDGVTSIGWNVFDSCTNLVNISIPDSLTSIDWSVFMRCTSLERINIPAGVTDIGVGVFLAA